MNTVTGLQTALNQLGASGVKQRELGASTVHTIFENRENLEVFQEAARRDGGAGWVALFQILFQVVILEKKEMFKKPTTAVKSRLTAMAGLVRFLAERAVHFLQRKPFLALFTHMTSLMVHDGSIFEYVAIDYAKTLRTLLSYPPHLEHLDRRSWCTLMSICWSAILGDRVTIEDEWGEGMEVDDGSEHGSMNGTAKKRMLSQSVASEIVALIPIMLSSSSAPLIPTAPPLLHETSKPALGLSILLKIYRYISQLSAATVVPIEILRALNLVLAEMELNCKDEFTIASLKLYPHLVGIWNSRNKGDLGLREHVLVALRMMLPFITHASVTDHESKEMVRAQTEKLLESLKKEATSRAAVRPLDLDCLLFKRITKHVPTPDKRPPFELLGLTAGFGFDAAQAVNWAALELFADCCFHTYTSIVPAASSGTNATQTQRAKRPRIESSLDWLTSATLHGHLQTRLLSCQVLIFLIDRHWRQVAPEAKELLKSRFSDLLDDEDVELQSWAFIGLAALARLDESGTVTEKGANPVTPAGLASKRRQEQSTWEKLWTYATRKTTVQGLSRAACHTADVLLHTNRVDHAQCLRDVHILLRNIDIQGPPAAFETACFLLETSLDHVRADAGLYSANLEDKVVDWFGKTFTVDRLNRVRVRLGSATPSTYLRLLGTICNFAGTVLSETSVIDYLPDCPIVNRVLEEARTDCIRHLILYGTMPALPDRTRSDDRSSAPLPPSQSLDTLSFLDGRPRKLSDQLHLSLEHALAEWKQGEKPMLITPERLRRGVDLVVLTLLFQAAIQANGLRPDTAGCLHPAASLLDLLLPHLKNLSDNVPAQHLVWQGFSPLYLVSRKHIDTWPIILQPERSSGIRRDILSPDRYGTHIVDDDGSKGDASVDVLATLWRRQETSEALADLVEASKSNLASVRHPGGGPVVAIFNVADEDDFGPIINADADAMPQSFEAKAAQRSTTSLLKILVDLRLRGPLLADSSHRPTKDVDLINTLSHAEGGRFAQLGVVICDAILEGSLRLTVEAVDFVLGEIHDRLSTYGFRRDGELIRFAILFLTRTAWVWLSPESGLADRAIDLARLMISQAEAGRLNPWQARLQLVIFIDEYLEYDPTYSAWIDVSESEEADIVMGGDERNPWGPVKFVLDATADRDARVRFRAATSAAAVHYLPDLPQHRKNAAYHDLVQAQSRYEYIWDFFLTNLIWKLNTCLASAQLRAATIFHLYEVADYARSFMTYLQPGLEAVAERLGLDSLKPLYVAHANIIVMNQLACGQLPLHVPPSLYGCSTRKEFAGICLEAVGAKILSEPQIATNLPFFTSLCQAAEVPEEQARRRHLPVAASIAVAQSIGTLDEDNIHLVEEIAMATLETLPTPDPREDVVEVVKANGEYVVSSLLAIVDLAASNQTVVNILESLETSKNSDPASFASLTVFDIERVDSPPVLEPSNSVSSILQSHAFFRGLFKSMSRRRMVFNALVRLFDSVNAAYLVNEQRRYLRSLALLASLYPTEFCHPMILQQFLRNVIDLLTMDDIGGMAASFLEWGFNQLMLCPRVPSEITGLMINLGSIYVTLQSKPSLQEIVTRLDAWVAARAQAWAVSETIGPIFQTTLVFWPPHWVEHFHLPDPLFSDMATIAERSDIRDPMALCRRLAAAAKADSTDDTTDTFINSTFWNLKKTLATSHWDHDGAMAFLDLLDHIHGALHAPSLNMKGSQPLLELAKQYKVPEVALRVAVLDKIVSQTISDDYRLRATAFEVLQTTLPVVRSMADKSLPAHLHDLLVYLVTATPSSIVKDCEIETLTEDAAGWVHKSRTPETWARDLADLLDAIVSQDDEFYACLQPLLVTAGGISVTLLPLLVQATLTCGAKDHPDVTKHRATVLSDHFAQILQFPSASTVTVEMIIQVLLHLRHFQPPYIESELAYNHWLSIDPLVLSEAAGRCGAYASSLLFLEMAQDRDDAGNQDLDLSSTRVQRIMYDIYSNVEDPDGFYGIQNKNVMDSLHRRLDHEGQPLRSLGYNLAGFEASHTKPSSAGPLVAAMRNLHDLGFDSLAGTVMKSLQGKSAVQTDSDPFFLELAWRMGDWDVPLTRELEASSAGRFYTALRAVHRERDRDLARSVVDTAIREEMQHLAKISVERMTEIKKSTVNLLCLRDVARWTSVPMQKAIDQGDFDGAALTGFVDLSSSFEFANAERQSATRLSLIRSARARESKNLLGDLMSAQSEGLINMEIKCQLRLSQLARNDLDLQAAVNAVTAVRMLEDGLSPSSAAQDEFSQVLWAQGEHALAIQHVNDIKDKLNSEQKMTSRHAVLMGRVAHWTSLAKLKSSEEIRLIFRSAMDCASKYKASNDEQAKIAYEFAVFTDRYYVTLSRSPELERLKSFVVRKKAEYNRLEQSIRSTPGSARPKMDKDQLELEEERNAKENLERELQRYLHYTLQSYGAALRYSDQHDDAMTRLISVWLEHDTNDKANEDFAPYLAAIPSHKFIFLAPQLAARLYRPTTPTYFNASLNKLMLRLSQDHPYHVLYQVITLAHGVAAPNGNSRSRASDASAVEGRGAAAAEIMAVLASDAHRPLAALAGKQMTQFANASVSWCYHNKVGKNGDQLKVGKEYPLPAACALLKCSNLSIPVVTAPPPVDLELKYEGIATIARYRSSFKVAGGIHHPSIMTCLDSAGQSHVQLFKGDDEVRQDAVMEQVFEMTNRLLKRDRRTKVRNLLFRTYTVVPLANSSGIIEFVGNTEAIGDWLKDAHKRYRKKVDVPIELFRKNLGKIQERDWASSKMVTTFKDMMSNFHPVMRHFFSEKRREPLAWFTMKLNYSRSVAVTSMVGHMVGLGDRHCSNILIDNISGELVHIDFGIVFEEGRKLRIPEKVPFRLTNDIVDGLGITGVDGTFRQCAEHTLRVLRDSSELILTVLEVFKHDPLYAWTGDPGKMRRAQGGGRVESSTSGQDKAERVLARIRQKLGRELSVEYSVNQLIQEARDPEHLAKIFVGWQSWL